MKEISYYKDFRHNYLILKIEEKPGESYERRMITDNKINGLVMCQERHVDDELLLYYDITSRQSLRSLYEGKKITFKEIRDIFVQIKMVWNGLADYLLNEQKLVLQPEYIFEDIESKELSFLYDPSGTEKSSIEALLEYFADAIDPEDENATEAVYRMLELIEKEQFVLDEVIEWFEEDYGEEKARENNSVTSCCEDINEEIYEHLGYLGERIEKQEDSEQGRRLLQKKNKIYFAFISLFALVLIGILIYIYIVYQLSQKLQILLIATFFLLVLLFGASISLLIYIGLKKDDDQREMRVEQYMDPCFSESAPERAQESFGNTVFIPWTECCENKLYGVGKENKNHIDLKKLPLTVGKLAGSVDMVIENASISRRHVKFFREGDRIYMSDLNSTNGTYKNGLRMQPNASEPLEPGDEIRLGKLKFIYR